MNAINGSYKQRARRVPIRQANSVTMPAWYLCAEM